MDALTVYAGNVRVEFRRDGVVEIHDMSSHNYVEIKQEQWQRILAVWLASQRYGIKGEDL